MRVISIATVLIASLAAAGAANAAPSGGRQGEARIGLGLAPGGAGHGGAAARHCFYTIPNCTSTDPSVTFLIVSVGDTSSCQFQTMTGWGDGQSTAQTFPGGADGSTLATFTHTYDKSKPQTWTLTITGSVPSGTCGAYSGTLQFTLLPDLGAAAVRFAPVADQSTNGSPGQPVIKDDGGSLTSDDKWGPTSCNGIPSSRSFDYLDCGMPVPTGTKSKVWPVIYAKGDSLTLDRVIFAANGQVPSPQLTATASVSGSASASLILPATPLSQAKVGSGYQLTASGLAFAGALPSVPGRDKLTITWTVTDLSSGLAVKTMTSEHVIYVTAGKYARPAGGVLAGDDKPYETVLGTGIVAASGVSGEQNVFNAIWRKFDTLKIKHPVLDPATGFVSDGPALTYYNNGFAALSDGFNGNRRGCTDLTGMLEHDSGHCGAWAAFLTMVLAFQGITAKAQQGLDRVGDFYSGPVPGPGDNPEDYAYMLVGPKLWGFKHGTAHGSYHFTDPLHVTPGGKVAITGSEVTYSSTKPIAQGPVTTPPMWFLDGDHAIVEVRLPGGMKWVDPSYGNPRGTGYYPDLKTYEKTAIAGFAVVYAKAGKKLLPVPLSAGLGYCVHHACYFQAAKL
jgi:hypothetical protein